MKDAVKIGWEAKPLGDVCKFTGGGTPSKQNPSFWGGDIPWVSPKDMKSDVVSDSIDHVTDIAIEQSAAKRIPEGAILIVVRSGILARTIPIAIAGRELTVNQDLKAIIPDRRLERRFLAYYFRAVEPQLLDRVTRGATVHKLDMPVIKSLPIPLPPLEEQRRIVAVLDEAFEGLARARTHAEANLQNARELFESAIDHVFSPASEWPKPDIADIGEVFDGPHATPKTVDAGPLFLGISSLVDGRIELTKTRHVTEDDFAKWTRRVIPEAGDVVFSYETRLGQVGLIPEGMRCCLGRRMGLIRLKSELIDPEYFVLCYMSPLFQKFLRSKTIQGTTVDRLSIKDFPKFPFPTPSRDQQAEIVAQVRAIRDLHDNLLGAVETKLQDLDDLRQSLLQKAFAGELT